MAETVERLGRATEGVRQNIRIKREPFLGKGMQFAKCV